MPAKVANKVAPVAEVAPASRGGSKTAAKPVAAPAKPAAKAPAARKQAAGSKTAVAAPAARSKATATASSTLKRTYKVFNEKDGSYHGRYTGDTPKQAANKAFTKIYRSLQQNGGKTPKGAIKLTIKETTRTSGSKKYRQHVYEASRVKLPQPESVKIRGGDGTEKIISYNYRNQIKKVEMRDIRTPEQKAGAKKKRQAAAKGSKTAARRVPAKGSKPAARKAPAKGSKTAAAVRKAPAKKATK